jgi:hypothetical protein
VALTSCATQLVPHHILPPHPAPLMGLKLTAHLGIPQKSDTRRFLQIHTRFSNYLSARMVLYGKGLFWNANASTEKVGDVI